MRFSGYTCPPLKKVETIKRVKDNETQKISTDIDWPTRDFWFEDISINNDGRNCTAVAISNIINFHTKEDLYTFEEKKAGDSVPLVIRMAHRINGDMNGSYLFAIELSSLTIMWELQNYGIDSKVWTERLSHANRRKNIKQIIEQIRKNNPMAFHLSMGRTVTMPPSKKYNFTSSERVLDNGHSVTVLGYKAEGIPLWYRSDGICNPRLRLDENYIRKLFVFVDLGWVHTRSWIRFDSYSGYYGQDEGITYVDVKK